MEMTNKEHLEKKRHDGWIEAWFAIEALAVNEETVKKALADHIKKLGDFKEVFIYEKIFKDVRKVENPSKNIKEGFSQIVELKLFLKDIYTLIKAVIIFGPSAIEILGPNNKEVKIDEIQSMANMCAGLVHQYALAGLGGIVITPEKK